MSSLLLKRQDMLRLKRAIISALIISALISPARGQLYPSENIDLSDQIDLQVSDEELLEIERNAELERKRHQKRKAQRNQNQLIKKENSLLKQLQLIDIQLSINRKEIAEYETKIQDHIFKAEKLQLELQALKKQYQQYKKRLAKRIRAIYKMGYGRQANQVLKLLISSESFGDLLERYKYASAIASTDQQLLQTLENQQKEIINTHTKWKSLIREIEVASKEAEDKQLNIITKKKEREGLLKKYRSQRAVYDQALKELKAAVSGLEELLGVVSTESITEKAEELTGVKKDLLGNIRWPVTGEIVGNQNPHDRGITIQAKSGTAVRCIADGIVARTIPSVVGYGNTVLIAHGNNYATVYTHLSETLVTVGDSIKTGKIIGKVGETGSLIGASLYFELWHNYERLNTREWLTKAP
ncbi:TPA: hypothetical protein EYM26_16450 [Candidatus Poribacteria bacterium]|nr:hypothetical protein [Candidatus Poribacteria bacterium]